MQSTELFYRETAARGASGFGMLIALYDTLAGDLRRAAEAERRSDLDKRCLEVNHAALVIGYLEDAIDKACGGDLAKMLLRLYASLRRNLIEAQARRSPELLEQQMDLVLSIRQHWQTMEFAGPDMNGMLPAALTKVDHYATPGSTSSQMSGWCA